MIKRFTKLAILLGSIGVTVSTVSFSYFYFGGINTGNNDALQDLRVDSIYENYDSIMSETGGSKLNDTTYTIYVFPSAEYLSIYDEYLLNPKTAVKPEDFNGYITPELNDDGTVKVQNSLPVYDTTHANNLTDYTPDGIHSKTFKTDPYVTRVEQNSNAVATTNQYKKTSAVQSGRGGQWFKTENQQSNYVSIPSTKLVMKPGHNQYYHFEQRDDWSWGSYYWNYDYDFYHSPYTDYWYSSDAGYQKNIYDIFHFHALNALQPGTNISQYRPYGDPADASMKDRFLNDTSSYYKTLFTGNPNGVAKNLFSADRYGYWEDLSLEEGRFKPIKITVKNSLAPQLFDYAIGEIGNSMCDGNKNTFFEAEFSGFTYVDFNKKAKNASTYPLEDISDNLPAAYDSGGGGPHHNLFPRDMLSSFDINNIFDASQSLKRYINPKEVDENGNPTNIIRLFPTFSSGKGYWSQISKNSKHGGSDAVKFDIRNKFTSPDNPIPAVMNVAPITAIPDNGSGIAQFNNQSITCSYLPNVPINIRGTQTTIKIRTHVSSGIGNWTLYKDDTNNQDEIDDSVGWINFAEFDFSKKELKDKINGAGYYNILLFVGSSGQSFSGVKDLITDYFKLGPNHNYEKDYTFLKGKKMWHLMNASEYIDKPGEPRAKFNSQRPYYVMLQKVTEPKVYMDIPLTSSIDSINNKINKDHDLVNTAYQFANPIYTEDNGFKRVYEMKDKPGKNDNNTFLFKNVDFTDVSYNYFQIRFGNQYNPNVKINTNGTVSGDEASTNPKYKMYNEVALAKDNAALTNYNQGIRFKAAFNPNGTDVPAHKQSGNFFVAETKSEQGVTYPFLKLRDDTCRGIYDMLFVLHSETSAVELGGVALFDLYVYRHTNIFVKIFEDRIDETITGNRIPYKLDNNDPNSENIYFINHTNPKKKGGGKLLNIFEKRYFIGDIMSINDKNKKDDKLLIDILNEYITTKGRNKKINFDNFVIRDQVAGTGIVWFKAKKSGLTGEDLYNINNFDIKFNPTFKITKNFVLYITTQKPIEKA